MRPGEAAEGDRSHGPADLRAADAFLWPSNEIIQKNIAKMSK